MTDGTFHSDSQWKNPSSSAPNFRRSQKLNGQCLKVQKKCFGIFNPSTLGYYQ